MSNTTPQTRESEENTMLRIINETFNIYFKHGARRANKVNYFHKEIQNILKIYFPIANGFEVKLEQKVTSCNSSGKKQCDIVVFKDNTEYIILPVKIIMTSYKKNKNNFWENLTGEVTHLKWRNPNVHIIPINILINKTPCLNNNKRIKKFENITISDINIYDELIRYNLCYDIINYIFEVEHIKKENEIFDKIHITNFDTNTPYRSFDSIMSSLY